MLCYYWLLGELIHHRYIYFSFFYLKVWWDFWTSIYCRPAFTLKFCNISASGTTVSLSRWKSFIIVCMSSAAAGSLPVFSQLQKMFFVFWFCLGAQSDAFSHVKRKQRWVGQALMCVYAWVCLKSQGKISEMEKFQILKGWLRNNWRVMDLV